jgi:hypothetical protein
MTSKRMTDKDLVRETARWETREIDPRGWDDAPEAVPRAGESTAISMRIPNKMLGILREFARRQGIGYQVLIKRWLDDRIRQEADALAQRLRTVELRHPVMLTRAASFTPGAGLEVSRAR